MNFLGHCYLCKDHMHLITGNLAGDFYKGNLSNFENLAANIQQGIKLHRFIDEFTDRSQHIANVAHIFQNEGIKKVSYIACDILLDHYLTRNWNTYSTESYKRFVAAVYAEVESNLEQTEPEFRFLFNKMKEYGWFFQYPDLEGISNILYQFSHRIGFVNNLAASSGVYISHQKTIDTSFKAFLKDIQAASNEFILDNRLDIS